MARSTASRLPIIISENANHILANWLSRVAGSTDTRLAEEEIEEQCEQIVSNLVAACRDGNLKNIQAPSFVPLRELLIELSLTRALQGFSAIETATFILSLKAPIFARLRSVLAAEPDRLVADMLTVSETIDALGLFTMDKFQQTREELIKRQQGDFCEFSTPVVRLWQGILALPLIGMLDAARTQDMMESLLESIVRYEAKIAIIDITGVATVDAVVAQHLLKTVAAARLMGVDCIVSGMRPQIAQTMVELGVELNVISKATLSDAFTVALRRLGKAVVDQRYATQEEAA